MSKPDTTLLPRLVIGIIVYLFIGGFLIGHIMAGKSVACPKVNSGVNGTDALAFSVLWLPIFAGFNLSHHSPELAPDPCPVEIKVLP